MSKDNEGTDPVGAEVTAPTGDTGTQPAAKASDREPEQPAVVIRDKRKVRDPGKPAPAPEAEPEPVEVAEVVEEVPADNGRPLIAATEMTPSIARTRSSTSVIICVQRSGGNDTGMLTVAMSR